MAKWSQRKRRIVWGVIAFIASSGGGFYWWWYRIVSDVPVFAPPEWVWLEGDVQLKVFPDSDELLIRRSRSSSGRDDFPPPRDNWEAQVQQDFLRNKYERRAIAQKRASANGKRPVLQQDYYYSYNSSDRTLRPIDSEAWNINGGLTETNATGPSGIVSFQVDDKIISKSNVYEALRRSRPPHRLLKTRTLLETPSPTLATCSAGRPLPKEQLLQRYRKCYRERPEIIAGLDPPARFAIVHMRQDRRDWSPGLLGGGGHPTKAMSGLQHFVDIVALPETVYMCKPMRINMVTDLYGKPATASRDYLAQLVWSVDSRYVVLVGLVSLAIIALEAIQESGK